MAHDDHDDVPETFDALPKGFSAFGYQDEYGIDLATLYANLQLTPAERLDQHQKALEMILEVRRAGRAAGLQEHLEESE
jgi:hypothetical protein